MRPLVIFVEDDEAIRKRYHDVLGRDFVALGAGSAEEAIDLLAGCDPNVVVTNQRLSGRDGIWLLQYVRDLPSSAARVLFYDNEPSGLGAHIASGLLHESSPRPREPDDLVHHVRQALARCEPLDFECDKEPSEEIAYRDREALDAVLNPENMRVLFQPIFRIGDQELSLVTLEGLVGGREGSSLEVPKQLFTLARRCHHEGRADIVAASAILRAAARLPTKARIAINVHASTMFGDDKFLKLLNDEAHALGIGIDRLVCELVEYRLQWVDSRFNHMIASFREQGGSIAVHDLGRGSAIYRKVLECRPELIKIDRYFIEDCHLDFARRAVLESIEVLCKLMGATPVAEGVEQVEELHCLTRLGIDHIQGYLLSRPLSVDELLLHPEILEGTAMDLQTFLVGREPA